ncbi:restriction endonuclease [Arcobacter sp. YIC-464]|uniref:nSTAND3 domain-containing NTPase n=1 Tax=Arcobacter sp. YIC-464 TaxID=3376631 RepID=UPI003C15DCA9
MVDYDFSTLNDKEFENITLELISKDRGKKYQRFKQGRDGGIDGIFFIDENNEEVVQCKHFLKSGYSQLKSKIKKEEIAKVKKLSPSKYIFVTSVQLTKANVDEIFNLFSPHIKSKNDIYYQEKLNNILKDNKDIEERNYKLWLNSTTVLSRIFNNAIKGRSQFLIEDIRDSIPKYIKTDSHKKAKSVLEKNKLLIISGEPGIGKTTLANFISLEYIEQGFEFIVIDDSIKEAEDVFNYDKKQLFYFDDFLGSNYLEALNRKDSHIVNFLKRIVKNDNKRFILTTRTIIFNQAMSMSDKFYSIDIQNHEFILKLNSLSKNDKEKLLYNHIYFSKLNDNTKKTLLYDDINNSIVSHSNFSPRLIEFITSHSSIINSNSYLNDVFESLNNPTQIWERSYENECDDFMRLIVIIIVYNGNTIYEYELIKVFEKIRKIESLKNDSYKSKEFTSLIKVLLRYFINRTINYDNSVEYSLFNPSIADFIIHRTHNIERILNIFQNLKTLESLETLHYLTNKKLLSKNILTTIINNLEDNDFSENTTYLIELFNISLMLNVDIDTNTLLKFINQFIDNNESLNYFEDNTYILINSLYLLKKREQEFDYIQTIEYLFQSHKINEIDEINSTLKFIGDFNLLNTNIINKLSFCISDYLNYELNNYNLQFNDLFYNYNINDLRECQESIIVEIKNYYKQLCKENLAKINLIPEVQMDYADFVLNTLDFQWIYQMALENEEFDEDDLID